MSSALSAGSRLSIVASTAAAGIMIHTTRGACSRCTRSVADEAAMAPSPASSCRAAASRSNTTHRWPALPRRRTMFEPMRPRPIIPSCMSLSNVVEGTPTGCGARTAARTGSQRTASSKHKTRSAKIAARLMHAGRGQSSAPAATGPIERRGWGRSGRNRPHCRLRRQQVGEGGAAAKLTAQQLQQLVDGACLSEQAALREVAAAAAQEIELALRLDTLGHHLHAEAMAHVDDGSYQYGIRRVVGRIAYERLIDLQSADRELLQRRQRRVAGAEVVDRQVQAHVVQLLQHLHRAAWLGHQGGLGDLQLEVAGRHLVALEHRA